MSYLEDEFRARRAQQSNQHPPPDVSAHTFRHSKSNAFAAPSSQRQSGSSPHRGAHLKASIPSAALTASEHWSQQQPLAQKEPWNAAFNQNADLITGARTKAGGVRHGRSLWSEAGAGTTNGSSSSNSKHAQRKQDRIAPNAPSSSHQQSHSKLLQLSNSTSKRSLASSSTHSLMLPSTLPPVAGAQPPLPPFVSALSWLPPAAAPPKPPNLMAWVKSIARLGHGGPVDRTMGSSGGSQAELMSFEQLQQQYVRQFAQMAQMQQSQQQQQQQQQQFASTLMTPEQFQAFYEAQQAEQATQNQSQVDSEQRQAASATQQHEPSTPNTARAATHHPSPPQSAAASSLHATPSKAAFQPPPSSSLQPHPPPSASSSSGETVVVLKASGRSGRTQKLITSGSTASLSAGAAMANEEDEEAKRSQLLQDHQPQQGSSSGSNTAAFDFLVAPVGRARPSSQQQLALRKPSPSASEPPPLPSSFTTPMSTHAALGSQPSSLNHSNARSLSSFSGSTYLADSTTRISIDMDCNDRIASGSKGMLTLSGRDLPADKNIVFAVYQRVQGQAATPVTPVASFDAQQWQFLGCTEMFTAIAAPAFGRSFILDAPVTTAASNDLHLLSITKKKPSAAVSSLLNNDDASTLLRVQALHIVAPESLAKSLSLSNPADTHLHPSAPSTVSTSSSSLPFAESLGEVYFRMDQVIDVTAPQEFALQVAPLTAEETAALKRKQIELQHLTTTATGTQLAQLQAASAALCHLSPATAVRGSIIVSSQSLGVLTPVALRLSCSNLPAKESTEPSIIVVFVAHPITGTWSRIGQTNTSARKGRTANSADESPSITVWNYSDRERKMRFAVYDSATSEAKAAQKQWRESDLIGEVFSSLSELLPVDFSAAPSASSSQSLSFRLMKRKNIVKVGGEPCMLTINATTKPSDRSALSQGQQPMQQTPRSMSSNVDPAAASSTELATRSPAQSALPVFPPAGTRHFSPTSQIAVSVSVKGLLKTSGSVAAPSPLLVLYISNPARNTDSNPSFELFAQSERRPLESNPSFQTLFLLNKEVVKGDNRSWLQSILDAESFAIASKNATVLHMPLQLKLCVFDANAADLLQHGKLIGESIIPLSSLLLSAHQEMRLSLPQAEQSSGPSSPMLTVQSMDVGRITKAFVAVSATGLSRGNCASTASCNPIATVSLHNPFLQQYVLPTATERLSATASPVFRRLLPIECWSDVDRTVRVAIYETEVDELCHEKNLLGEAFVSLKQLAAQAELAANTQRAYDQSLLLSQAHDGKHAAEMVLAHRQEMCAGLFVKMMSTPGRTATASFAASPFSPPLSPTSLAPLASSSGASSAPTELFVQLIWDSSEWTFARMQSGVERHAIFESCKAGEKSAPVASTKAAGGARSSEETVIVKLDPNASPHSLKSTAAAAASPSNSAKAAPSSSAEVPAAIENQPYSAENPPRLSDESFAAITSALKRLGARLFPQSSSSAVADRSVAEKLVWHSATVEGVLKHLESFVQVGRTFRASADLLPAVVTAERTQTHLLETDVSVLVTLLQDPQTVIFRDTHPWRSAESIPGENFDALVTSAGGVEQLVAHIRAFAKVGREFSSMRELIDALEILRADAAGIAGHLAPEVRTKLINKLLPAKPASGHVSVLKSGVVLTGAELDSIVMESKGLSVALDFIKRLEGMLLQFASASALVEALKRLSQGLNLHEHISSATWSAVVAWMTAPTTRVLSEVSGGVAIEAAVLETLLQRTGGEEALLLALRDLDARSIKLRAFADLLQAITGAVPAAVPVSAPVAAAPPSQPVTAEAVQSTSSAALAPAEQPTSVPAPVVQPQPPVEAEVKQTEAPVEKEAQTANQSAATAATSSEAPAASTVADAAVTDAPVLAPADKSQLSAYLSTAPAQKLFPSAFSGVAAGAAVDVFSVLSLRDSDVLSAVSLSGGSIASLILHLDLFVSVARVFTNWADLITGLEEVKSSGSHVTEETRQSLLDYLSADSVRLFNAATLEIDMESIDALLASAGGLETSLSHLKILNACGRKFNSFPELSQAILFAVQKGCHVTEEEQLQLKKYLMATPALFDHPLAESETVLTGLQFDRFYSCGASKSWHDGLLHHFTHFLLAERKFPSVLSLLEALERVLGSGESYVTEETRESLIAVLIDFDLFAPDFSEDIVGFDLDALVYAGRGFAGAKSHLSVFSALHRKFECMADLIAAMRAATEEEQAGGGCHLLEADRQHIAAQLSRVDSALLVAGLQPTAVLQGAHLDSLVLAAGGVISHLLNAFIALEQTKARCTSFEQLIELVKKQVASVAEAK